MSASDNGFFGGNVYGDQLYNQQDTYQIHAHQDVGEQEAVFYGMTASIYDHPGVDVGYGQGLHAAPDGSMDPGFVNNPYTYTSQAPQQVPAEAFDYPLPLAHNPTAAQGDFGHMDGVNFFNQGVSQEYTYSPSLGVPVLGAPFVDYGHQVGNLQGPFMGEHEGYNGGTQLPYFRTAEPAEPNFGGDYRLFASPKFTELDLEASPPLNTPALFDAATGSDKEEEPTPCPKRRKVGGGQQTKARKPAAAARSARVRKNGQVRKVRAPRPKLCKWDETDFMKALIGVVVSCHKDGHKIDFSAAAAVVSPTCSGHALRQAILKARDRLVREGHDFVKIEMHWN